MMRPGSALVRGKPKVKAATGAVVGNKKTEVKKPQLEDFLKEQNYTGAITLLEFERRTAEQRPNLLLWLAYCLFHNGDYKKAIDTFDEILRTGSASASSISASTSASLSLSAQMLSEVRAYKACCLYALCMYEEAEAEALKAQETPLQVRLLFHVAHKRNDENKLMMYHQKIQDTPEDQLCLAALHFLRSHFQEATDIYKRLLLDNREFLALNVYVALCYYKLDYYDVSLEILAVYLSQFPNSIVAVNLKACNHYQLYNGKAAEAELKVLQQATVSGNIFQDNDLLRHNLVVFRNGENALQVFPPLVEVIPEARLNLVIYYLRNDEVQEAYNLIKDLEPSGPLEYRLKGVVHAAYGQKYESREHLKLAQQLFQLVGASPSECDTIPGRQCMASCFFLLRQFDDVLVYLKSIRTFFQNDDDFNWNFGIACASAGEYKEAEEALLLVQNERYKSEYCYVSWLARCYIMNSKPSMAWETYLKMDTTNESFSLLQLIANDCYRMGQFFYAAKAFDVLERLDPDPEYWEGKRGAAVGVFQQVVAGRESRDRLTEVINLLKITNNPQVEYIVRAIKKWAKENNVKI